MTNEEQGVEDWSGAAVVIAFFIAVVMVISGLIGYWKQQDLLYHGYEQVDGEWKPTELTWEILAGEGE